MAVCNEAAYSNNADRKGEKFAVSLALLAVYLVWGSTYLAMRFALKGFPPFLLGGIRFLIAGAILYATMRLKGLPNPTGREWGGAAVIGILLLGGGNGGVVFAEQWVSSGMAALVIGTTPLWVALLSGFFGNWPRRSEWVGLVVGLLGLACLSADGGLRASPVGAVALIVAAMSWAFGSVLSGRLALPGGLMAPAAQMLCGGAVMLVLGLAGKEHLPQQPGTGALGAMAYLIAGAIVGYSAYTYLLRTVRPALATSYAYVNPVVAVLLGALLAGEKVTAAALLALLLIVIGVALTAFAKQKKTQ